MSEGQYTINTNFTPAKDYNSLLEQISELFEFAKKQEWEQVDIKWGEFSSRFDIVQNKYSNTNWDDCPDEERKNTANSVAKIVEYHDLLIEIIKQKQSQVQNEISTITTASRLSKAYK